MGGPITTEGGNHRANRDPLFVGIVSDYPDETTDLTFAVDPRFGETAAGLQTATAWVDPQQGTWYCPRRDYRRRLLAAALVLDSP